MTEIKKINPKNLAGPRSYFTDIYPNDKNYDKHEAIQKLKLQLLTKEKIIVAASSLFHNIWLDIFKESPDLIPAIENGIIVPAIRNQFTSVADFFENKKYPEPNKKFFMDHVTYYVPWDLDENTSWFKQYFIKGLKDHNSVLRKTVFSYLGTAIRLSPERLDNLEFRDILTIRKTFFDEGFSLDYDNLVSRQSSSVG